MLVLLHIRPGEEILDRFDFVTCGYISDNSGATLASFHTYDIRLAFWKEAFLKYSWGEKADMWSRHLNGGRCAAMR